MIQQNKTIDRIKCLFVLIQLICITPFVCATSYEMDDTESIHAESQSLTNAIQQGDSDVTTELSERVPVPKSVSFTDESSARLPNQHLFVEHTDESCHKDTDSCKRSFLDRSLILCEMMCILKGIYNRTTR